MFSLRVWRCESESTSSQKLNNLLLSKLLHCSGPKNIICEKGTTHGKSCQGQPRLHPLRTSVTSSEYLFPLPGKLFTSCGVEAFSDLPIKTASTAHCWTHHFIVSIAFTNTPNSLIYLLCLICLYPTRMKVLWGKKNYLSYIPLYLQLLEPCT